jgi:glutamate dehydrogenase/leucine dehydrogenase
VQNVKMEEWELEEAHEKLEKKMQRSTDAVFDRQQALNGSLGRLAPASRTAARPDEPNGEALPEADLRTAAYVLALDRVAQTCTERGVWP